MHYTVSKMPREIGSSIWSTVIAPRPILLIVSRNADGVNNIAPYNSISCISSYPPVVSISFGMRMSEQKQTLVNISTTKTFSLNVVPFELRHIANEAAVGAVAVDDFERLGLTTRIFDDGVTVGILESPASIACEIMSATPVDGTRCTLVLARCSEVIIDDKYAREGLLDSTAANLMASVGVEEYISLKGEAFTMPRLWE